MAKAAPPKSPGAPDEDDRPTLQDVVGRDPLSPREIEILDRLIAGHTVKEVAFTLSITLATARAHVRNILHKLGVHRQIDAVLVALHRGPGASPRPDIQKPMMPKPDRQS